ncbi:hypothetical protein U1Q18_043689 [Sarracenia purpurea var. burkii]
MNEEIVGVKAMCGITSEEEQSVGKVRLGLILVRREWTVSRRLVLSNDSIYRAVELRFCVYGDVSKVWTEVVTMCGDER